MYTHYFGFENIWKYVVIFCVLCYVFLFVNIHIIITIVLWTWCQKAFYKSHKNAVTLGLMTTTKKFMHSTKYWDLKKNTTYTRYVWVCHALTNNICISKKPNKIKKIFLLKKISFDKKNLTHFPPSKLQTKKSIYPSKKKTTNYNNKQKLHLQQQQQLKTTKVIPILLLLQHDLPEMTRQKTHVHSKKNANMKNAINKLHNIYKTQDHKLWPLNYDCDRLLKLELRQKNYT